MSEVKGDFHEWLEVWRVHAGTCVEGSQEGDGGPSDAQCRALHFCGPAQADVGLNGFPQGLDAAHEGLAICERNWRSAAVPSSPYSKRTKQQQSLM